MKFKYVIAAALATATTPAFAQDADVAFGGFKIGGLAGLDSVTIDDGTDSGSEENILYGFTAGYDIDLGTVILGLEGEFSESSVSLQEEDVLADGDSGELSAGRDIYVGGRLGAKIGGSGIAYVKGGYTDARVELEYSDGIDSLSEGDNLGGFRIGGGAEFSIGANIGMRVEYRYSDYGEYTYDGVATGLSASRHQGVIMLFGKF